MPIDEWFKNLITDVVHRRTIDFVITPPLSIGGQLPTMGPLVIDESYLRINVKRLRLPFSRELTSRMYGVVHSFVNLPGGGREAVELASATMPAALAGLDPQNASNVVVIDKPIAGPTPWHGGDLRLQIGLFSVVEQDLAGPFLSTMTALSDAVGVSFVGAAKPIMHVINTGISAISRAPNSVRLEIGLDKNYSPPIPGNYAIIAAPRASLTGAKFDLDPNDGHLTVNGADYQERPYLVFTIESVERQDRWGEIAELREAYSLVRTAVRDNDRNKVTEAMTSFCLLARTSPDLTGSDAERLISVIQAKLAKVFSSAVVSKSSLSADLPEFSSLSLYE